MSSPDAPPVTGDPPDGTGIDVSIHRGRLIGLLLVNILLTILTLGFYRFWARTKVRQRLWGAVSIQGEALVYTGTGKELFVGFLIALVVLVPFAAIVTMVTNLIPPTDVLMRVTLQIGVGLVAALLGILALYFARRYLLTRTRWRGVHAGQGGSLREFMVVHLKAYGLSFLTLGLIQPWADARTYNYRTGITWFGTENFSADATTKGLWRPWLSAWVLYVVGYVLLIIAILPFFEWSQALQAAQAAGQPVMAPPALNKVLLFVSIGLMFAGMLSGFLYGILCMTRFLGVTHLGATGFSLPVGWRQVIYIPAVAMLAYIVLFAGFFGLIQAMLSQGPDPARAQAFTLLLFLYTFAIMIIIQLLSVAWTQVEVLSVIGRHLRIDNIDAINDVVNRGSPAPRRGEGLADALGDVGIGA